MLIHGNITMAMILFGGTIWVQIYLSKKDNKYLGLILPALNGLWATVMALVTTPTYDEITTSVNGVVVEVTRTAIESSGWHMLFMFILLNIGTLVLLLIYKNCRGKLNDNKNLQEMPVV